MSLALVQGYSSEEEVQERLSGSESDEEDKEEEDDEGVSPVLLQGDLLEGHSHRDCALLPSSSLPSATAIFSEVTGPPDFLKDTVGPAVGYQSRANPRKFPYGTKLPSKTLRKDIPAGAIVEAKPQAGALIEQGVHVGKKEPPHKPTEDAAKLLGVCPQCSVPKTYSAAKEGLICPICKDRPADLDGDPNKRRGSRVKDKERSKRMKGQSSHATWKSETEMHLRQQFD